MAGSSAYASASTPASNGSNLHEDIQDASRCIGSLNQLTRSMQQKISLFGTPQDSRANHQQLTELAEKGKKHITKLNARLQTLARASTSNKPQIKKLATDFKQQVRLFEETCAKLMTTEQQAIDALRRSSSSMRGTRVSSHYHEDQIYAQAQVTYYDEDDLARREEDLAQINHQLREVHAAFREVDDLVRDQGEVVVQVEENAADTKETVGNALDNVRQADEGRKYCGCSKFKMILYTTLVLLVVILIVTLITSMK